jgi:regulator of cell morphogenesis and NO signaling
MRMLDPSRSLADLTLEHSACEAVLHRLRIDYCCKGGQTLIEACAEKELSLGEVVGRLEQAIAEGPDPMLLDPRDMTTPELVGYLVSRHHAWARRALESIGEKAEAVAQVHGEAEPRMVEVARAALELAIALTEHLDDEEAHLFPELMAGRNTAAVRRRLAGAEEEHVAVGALIERVRLAADDYQPPAWACRTLKALYAELDALEADVQRHVHLEAHVLFPRFSRARK